MIKTYNTKESVIVVGDIHGKFERFFELIEQTNSNNTSFVVCGDVGLGFKDVNDIFIKENEILKEKNNDVFFIRGNHDKKSIFDNEEVNFSNIKSIPDYSVLITPYNHYILCIGGAISIDRCSRIEGKSYWSDEEFIYNPILLDQLIKEYKFDYVITHTSPSFTFKSTFLGIEYWLNLDPNLKNDLIKERFNVSNVFFHLIDNDIKPKKWIYGHFHEHYSENIDNTLFVTLSHLSYIWDIYKLV